MPDSRSLQPAYILHSRPYQDSSLILELLTPESGRISCVARGGRRDKQRRQRALQPFAPLLVTLLGKGSLKTLGPMENAGNALWLRGKAVYAGLYANELLIRLLAEGEAQLKVFAHYQLLLSHLALLSGESSAELEAPLRQFELKLLAELGSCPQLNCCGDTGAALIEDGAYQVRADTGLIPVFRAVDERLRADEFRSVALLGLHGVIQGNSISPTLLPAAKRLTRLLLHPLLADRPLRSRELFAQVYRSE